MFINSFNYFRGIAILFIVAAHCYDISGWWIDTFPEKVFCAVVTGGTALFVFISGFLFHHVFYKNFTYKNFMMKKIKNVYCPYLILSAFPLILYVFIWHYGPFSEFFFNRHGNFYLDYLRPLLLYLWWGRTLTAYWYISFIMVVFLASPVFIRFIHASRRVQIICILTTLAVAMVVHRPLLNIGVFHSVFYYLPVYLFGIFSSMNRDFIYTRLAGKEIHLFIPILLLAIAQVVFFNNWGNFHKPPFVVTVPDINIIQKMIMCIFFMVLLQRLENRNVYLLKETASASFAIYFIHPIILEIILRHHIVAPTKSLGIISWVITVCCLTGVSYVIARIFKRLLGDKSRIFIGW
jgi:probable poly-beta-1,6-N-acetyl-D-glucosamine export protein